MRSNDQKRKYNDGHAGSKKSNRAMGKTQPNDTGNRNNPIASLATFPSLNIVKRDIILHKGLALFYISGKN
ncbi:hypothetical protein ORI89_12245 [Sphingobacterium sp. UT-1RO-CII-1]|uniref:hypothetical protein n=1 Tax=Sphingobacterium sp. UT-1RO-CII-1 TaxID=2995225 RepID=UPI00227C5CE1|nr:hypothetical protein [Sphingobacterium sp. UT-1RO-CII-1]MCY4780426.1 hypothetical protein [Sphingobacterium sp. UT-1RO-CII-1]